MASLRGSAPPLALVAVLLLGCGSGAAPGMPSPSPSHTATASASPTQSPGGLTRDQAIAAARLAVPSYASEAVLGAESGTYADLAPGHMGTMATSAPSPGRLVWRVTLGENAGPTGARIATILVDFWTGGLIGWTEVMA